MNATKGRLVSIDFLVYPTTALRATDNDDLYDDLEAVLDRVGEAIATLVFRNAMAINGQQMANVRRGVQTALTDVFIEGASAGKREAIIRYERMGLIDRLLWAVGLKRRV